MRFGTERMKRDTERTKTLVFVELCRKIKGAFTRTRKLPLLSLLLTILHRKGLALSMEIREFVKEEILDEKISKTGYLKQRKKLNPLALLDLCQFHNRGLYDDGVMKTHKGYLILAEDGSNINIPTTAETLAAYGISSRTGTKPQASLGLSCLYDCINKTILTCGINRVKFNEAAEAEAHLAQLPSLVGDYKSIITLDRGYPSIPFFLRLNNKEQKFVVRLRSGDFKEEISRMKTNDETVGISITNSRLNHYKGTDDYGLMVSAGRLLLRIVKFMLPSGETEILATNLSKGEFDTLGITELYACRWGVETAFDTLKNKLSIENFTGTKPILIEQDIYASIYVCNLASDMIADAEAKLNESNAHNERKHPMAINRSFAIGILKDTLISAILAETAEKKDALFAQMVEDTMQEVLPVRPGRQFQRTKGVLAGKFSNTRKRNY